MIFSRSDLERIYNYIVPNEEERDWNLINPASIDIRVGNELYIEVASGKTQKVSINSSSEDEPYIIQPGEFFLAGTYEKLHVPRNCAVELKLKSSRARAGWDHSLAFWFDPGWNGYGTMEIKNITRYTPLPIWKKMRFAQIIVHRLTTTVKEDQAYQGRYQGAESVETFKPGS